MMFSRMRSTWLPSATAWAVVVLLLASLGWGATAADGLLWIPPQAAPIPTPGTLLLMLSGALVLGSRWTRRR